MKIYYIFLSAIIIGFTGCNILKNDISARKTNDYKVQFHSKNYFIDSSKITFIECDEFVSNALSRYNIEIITKIYPMFDCTIEPVINSHDSSFIDTVYTFTDSKNKIQIYRAIHKDFVITFDVSDSKFGLRGKVKVGLTKELFIRKFQIDKPISNEVQVANVDGSMRFIFYFKNNRLQRIKSDLYLD